MRRVYGFLLCMCLSVAPAWGAVVQFTEPTENDCSQVQPASGVCPPLDDLAAIELAVMDTEGTPLEQVTIPATSPNGGGPVAWTFALAAPDNGLAVYAVCAVGVDLAGSKGAPRCQSVTVTGADTIPPAQPGEMTITVSITVRGAP